MAIDRKELKAAAKQQISGNIATYFGLNIVLGLILSASAVSFIGPIILAGPLQLGLVLFMMQVVRKGEGEFGTGFKGFNYFGSSFIAGLLMSIFICLWTLLFYIPGIIAALRYSMTFYILADNPELSGYDAIKKSKEMMIGHKWELFVLLLSFFWWYVLGAITLGLAYIYVQPYVDATLVNYYEKLKAEQNTAKAE
ncbi:MAG: DUF975 family protein [Spirochaetales bacterium]|nr:DUF975 family protein [Spirochaetales bacterium]